MSKANQMADLKAAQYVTKSDFCQVFNQDMSSLYLLSFLLTADREKAEECFVAGLEDSVEGSRVFKEWARSWARRTIIQNAVRIINPRPPEGNGGSDSLSINSNTATAPMERLELAAVLKLAPFDRFVFVMSVLERYSDQDCSLLLSCTRHDVLAARTRALQQIGRDAEFYLRQQVSADSEEPAPRGRDSSVLEAAA